MQPVVRFLQLRILVHGPLSPWMVATWIISRWTVELLMNPWWIRGGYSRWIPGSLIQWWHEIVGLCLNMTVWFLAKNCHRKNHQIKHHDEPFFLNHHYPLWTSTDLPQPWAIILNHWSGAKSGGSRRRRWLLLLRAAWGSETHDVRGVVLQFFWGFFDDELFLWGFFEGSYELFLLVFEGSMRVIIVDIQCFWLLIMVTNRRSTWRTVVDDDQWWSIMMINNNLMMVNDRGSKFPGFLVHNRRNPLRNREMLIGRSKSFNQPWLPASEMLGVLNTDLPSGY